MRDCVQVRRAPESEVRVPRVSIDLAVLVNCQQLLRPVCAVWSPYSVYEACIHDQLLDQY